MSLLLIIGSIGKLIISVICTLTEVSERKLPIRCSWTLLTLFFLAWLEYGYNNQFA